MPYRCCVPNCKGNYPKGPNVSVFSFPSEENLRHAWLKAISRDNFQPSKTSKVCELHFQAHQIQRVTTMYDEKTGHMLSAPLAYPRLVEGAVPNQLPYCPSYLSKPASTSRESPNKKRMRLEMAALNSALENSVQSFQEYQEERSFVTLHDFKLVIGKLKYNSKWTMLVKEKSVVFVLIEELPQPALQCSVTITEELSVVIFHKSTQISKLNSSPVPKRINNINQVDDILEKCYKSFSGQNTESNDNCTIEYIVDSLNSLKITPENELLIAFLKEQVSLLNVAKHKARYSPEFVVFCTILQSISPHAYNFFRSSGYVKLPCTSTLKLLTSKFDTDPIVEQNPECVLQYIGKKFSLLSDTDKTVVLLMDEIFLKPRVDYKGGSIVGTAINEEENASTACVFMVTSMLSSFKDVVHILPVRKLTGELLNYYIKTIIIGLEKIGFEVIAVISDNNPVNRKAMSMFCNPPKLEVAYQHPCDSHRQLFFLFDSVHLVKCIRNNWLNQDDQEINFPDMENGVMQTASFSCLKTMYQCEKLNILKYGHNLNLKSLYPSSLERQNVKLALNIINRNTVTALRELGPMKQLINYDSTATFLEYICCWWDIVNVKTPHKGFRLRNNYQEPVADINCKQLEYLTLFLKWLSEWGTKSVSKTLSLQTHSALTHTTKGLISISIFLLTEKKFKYVLLGKLQTDKLEDRFGKYRQLSGGNYHVSVREIFESEKKLRIQSVFPLVVNSAHLGQINISKDDVGHVDLNAFLWDECTENSFPHLFTLINVNEDDLDGIADSLWPIITYIGGYCSHAAMKKLNCGYCSNYLINTSESMAAESYINASNRGGLKYPSMSVVTCVAYSFLILNKILKNAERDFLHLNHQKGVLMNLATRSVPGDIFCGFSCLVHKSSDIIKYILSAASNILLNNYVKKKNDVLAKNNMPKEKRKQNAQNKKF